MCVCACACACTFLLSPKDSWAFNKDYIVVRFL